MNRKIDQRKTKQIVVDKPYHLTAKKKAADLGVSIKHYLESLICFDNGLDEPEWKSKGTHET